MIVLCTTRNRLVVGYASDAGVAALVRGKSAVP